MRINTNVSALVSYHSLARSTGKLEKQIARLSTGLKISSAADDAAGLAISEKMRAQTNGLDRAYQNAQDGISLLQTAEGAVGDIHDALQRIRELSVHAANGAITDDDRVYIQQQVDQLISHINDIATQTQFNKKKLLNGDASVLWSSDSRDVGVIVTGKITSKDIFGNVESKAGNYKITFSESVTGTENVQKSNVLSLKHGTSESNVVLNTAESGLANLQALNLVEGSWRVETRETPFGGVSFYQNGQLTDKGNISIDSLQATGTPHTVAFGEYDIRVSNKVPFMATFNTDVVDGINISNKALARDFDVEMATAVGADGTGATQMKYDGATGGDGGPANVGINTTTNANVFTRYEVTNVDARDTLAAQLQIQESYKAADNAVVGATLTYNSGTQTDASATFTYRTADSTIGYTSTWRTTSAQTITATLTYNVASTDPITGLPTSTPQTDILTIDIAAGSDIEDISNKITNDLLGGYGINVNHNDTAGTSTFSIQNQSDLTGTHRNVTVGFSGGLATELNMARTVTAGNHSDFSTGKDWETTRSVHVDAAKSIADVATELNKINGIVATTTTTDDMTHIVLTQNGTGAYGNNAITFATVGAGNAFNELGISGKSVTQMAGATASGTDVMNGKTVTLGTFSNQNINGVATALGTALNGAATGATTSAVSKFNYTPQPGNTYELARFNMVNNSMYDINVSGGVVGELTNNAGLSANRGATSGNTLGVFDNYMRTVSVAGGRLSDIQTNLNNTIDNMLTVGDQITANNGATNRISRSADGRDTTLTLNNTATTGATSTKYDIVLSDVSGVGALGEMWKTNRNATLGSNITSTGIAFQYTHNINGAAKDADMATVFAAINNDTTNPSLVNLRATWVDDPTQPDAHWGTMRIVNNSNNASGDTRRVYQIQNTGTDKGENYLNGASELGTRWLTNQNNDRNINLEIGQGFNSNHWQTKDAVQVKVTAQGNYSDGTEINRETTVGKAGAAAYGDKNDITRDWLWEGDAAEAARNTNKMNAQFGNNISTDFYTNFQVGDGTTASNIDKGDKWILFTQANTAPGSTNVSVKVGDSVYGKQDEVIYSFNNGVLSGGNPPAITQMIAQTDKLKPDYLSIDNPPLRHNILFGAAADAVETRLQYGERAGAMDAGYTVEDWRMGQEVDAWYSHAYFGENTTYHFANGTVDSMIHDITVNRQNGINASIMFYKDEDGKFKYSMKGVDDDGIQIGSTTAPKTEEVVIEADGSATIEGVKFDKFDVNVAGMLTGDKFVVNVAAAAKLVTANTEATAGAYESYANIQVTGDPFLQGNENTGSTAQYRVKQNVEDGATFNLLGHYVNPANGASSEPGVGYYDGDLVLKMNGGFNTDTTIGSTSPTTAAPGANIIHTEVNYQGKTQFSAGALVTSAYFQAMINQHDLVVADLVQGISYSDYKFGYTDGVFGELKQARAEKYSDMNGSVVFDVVEAQPDSIKFRVQGHFIDRDGNEYYEEDEEFFLYPGLNTDKDSSVQPVNDNPVMPVHLFKDSAFGGIFFDEFKLGKIDNWTAGDRFTVALTASGFIDNIDEASQLDPQNTNYSKVDEIGIFSDNRGTAMPMSYRFNDGVLDGNKVDLRIYQVAHNIVKEDSNNFYVDQVLDGTLTLSFADDYVVGKEIGKVDRAASFDVFYGQGDDYGVAHYYSNVKDIAQFYDKSGRFILDGNEETLTIRQGDREAKVAIGSAWEVGELASAVSDAIWDGILEQHDHMLRGESDLLDQDKEKPYMVADKDRNRIFDFVNTVAHDNATESVVGTLIAHSVISGEGSALEFYGSEALQNAFGFNTIQQGSDTHFTANVVDAHSGSMVSSNVKVVAGTTSTDLLFEGVAVTIDNDLGIVYSTYDKTSGTFKLDVRDQINTVIHLADNTTTLQIGANEGEKMTLDLADMSAKALGIANISVRSRTSAARTITIIDNAINVVSQQRAVIGAQINRLEHTMSNLANTSTNLQDSRSRIVSADIAKEMMNKTRIDIVTQAGASMLVQANQMGSSVMSLLR